MSLFDSFDDVTTSPFRVAFNFAEDFSRTQDLPSWHDFVSAFKKHDDSNLPELQLTNKAATDLTADIMKHGNVTVSRVSDIYPSKSPQPFTLSKYGG
jgi:hypothetical protein